MGRAAASVLFWHDFTLPCLLVKGARVSSVPIRKEDMNVGRRMLAGNWGRKALPACRHAGGRLGTPTARPAGPGVLLLRWWAPLPCGFFPSPHTSRPPHRTKSGKGQVGGWEARCNEGERRMPWQRARRLSCAGWWATGRRGRAPHLCCAFAARLFVKLAQLSTTEEKQRKKGKNRQGALTLCGKSSGLGWYRNSFRISSNSTCVASSHRIAHVRARGARTGDLCEQAGRAGASGGSVQPLQSAGPCVPRRAWPGPVRLPRNASRCDQPAAATSSSGPPAPLRRCSARALM